jgi:DNA end-binding protein Ku
MQRQGAHLLHQIHKVCNSRVRQPLFCPTCNRFVDRGEIVKGFEFDEGQYVLMEDKEVKKIATGSSQTLEIAVFTKLKEIDPIFFDSSYFCLPEDAGKKAPAFSKSLRRYRDRWDWETVDASA